MVARLKPADLPQYGRRMHVDRPISASSCSVGELFATSPIRHERRKMLSSRVRLGRFGQPDEIAKAVVFLASNNSSYVTGPERFVDGGFAQV
jgi:NAD(P)-dependent dehydrogenase (short-subunit alcohol dehydrogenase family)